MSIETTGAPTAASPTADQTETNEAASAGSEGSTPAASSPADEADANQPADLLSVVKSAVAPEEDAGADSSTVEGEEGTAAKPGEGEGKPAEGELTPEQQAEADAKLPFHEHPRWKEVVAERNSFREDAGRFRQIDSFMQEAGLLPEEVAEGFDIMAKLKRGTPESLSEAREYFASRLTMLDTVLGKVLPDDLQERVESGELTDEAAQELAGLRAADKLRKEQETARETATTADQERQALEARATAMATAVGDWEARQKAADPDYAKKAALVETTCRAIVQRTGKTPSNPEEAVQLVDAALKEVNESFTAFAPAPKPIRRHPSGSSAPTIAEPKNLREAIQQAASAAA